MSHYKDALGRCSCTSDYKYGPWIKYPCASVNHDPHHQEPIVSKYRGEFDYLPSWDDRKTLADVWQAHAPLPHEGLSEAVYDALIAVATWGYKQRADEEPEDLTEKQ